MAHITDFIENSLEHSVAGKALDARMGKEILKRPSISIPRLDMQVRKTPTNGIPNTVIVKLFVENNTEFMHHNPVIVLMRKRNAKNGGKVNDHIKNKWVEPGTSDGDKRYLSNSRDLHFGIQSTSWFTPRLQSDVSVVMSCDLLMNPFIKDLSKIDNPQFILMTSQGGKSVSNGGVESSLFGLAIRIDNPKFEGDKIAYPACTMFQKEPKYIYGEITKLLFRIEVKDGLHKSLAVL
jgi:hypothetical protein